MNLASMTLMGLFVWSSLGASQALTPPAAAEETPEQVAQPLAAATERSFKVLLTGYNAVPEQTDSSPEFTGWGIRSNPETVAAVSQDLLGALPYGTVIAIEAANPTGKYCGYEAIEHLIGYRVVADAMNPRWTDMVDILLDEDDFVEIGVDRTVKKVNPAKALGSCGGVTVRVVGKLDKKEIPQTQAELAMRVEQTLALK